ncbi:MAG: aminodeoxychorismate synthase component I [bacterium]
MYIKEIKQPSLVNLAITLSKYNDFFWLDSASSPKANSDDHSFSVLGFHSTKACVFSSRSDQKRFLSFLNNVRSFSSSAELSCPCFQGGWVGYFSYETYQYNKNIPKGPTHKKEYPLSVFRYYDTFIYKDFIKEKIYFVSFSNQAQKRYNQVLSDIQNSPVIERASFNVTPLKESIQRSQYNNDFSEIQKALESGDYLELNYTQEFTAGFSGNPFSLFLELRKTTKAPMMAFLNFPEVCVLSASPERFFKISNNTITMNPIKGTIQRGKNIVEDNENKVALIKSKKDMAELLMVTDMLRNDLGRICQTGTVRVVDLAKAHTFTHYHHLISKIKGSLKPGISLEDIFHALFPCGSITGAPKIKVMEHIDKLERRARGVYTGGIGLISDNGYIDFNVPIRTITILDNLLSYSAGGGIVIDSKCNAEYEECLVKTNDLSETIKNYRS